MKHPVATLAVLAALIAPAAAQQFPLTLPQNTVYGRLGASSGPGQAIPFATLKDRLLGTAGPGLFTSLGATGQSYFGPIATGGDKRVTISGTFSKVTPTGNQNLMLISNDAIANNPLALTSQVIGNATSSLRRGEIQVSEFGLGTYHDLALQSLGGNVVIGLPFGTATSAMLDVRGTAQIANTTFLPFLPAPVWTQAFSRIGNLYSSTYQQALAINQVVPLSADIYPAYEADALHVSTRTTDPSNVNSHDAVAIAAYGTIASTNTNGRVWAHFAQGAIETGGDGVIYGFELSVQNFGTSQPLVSTTTSKYNLNLTTEGNPTTAGIIFNPTGPGWHKGIYAEPVSFTGAAGSQFIELLGKFTVAKTGFTAIGGTTLTAHPVGVQAESSGGFAIGIQGRASDGAGVISFYSNNLGTLYASLSSNSASQLLSSSTFAPSDDGLRNNGTTTNAWLNTYSRNYIVNNPISGAVRLSALVYNNVRDAPFNAACDGSTNDAVAIQAAITAAASNKGPVVISAVCVSGPLTTPGGVKFLGVGANATLKAHSSVSGTYLLINQNTGSYIDSDITIENLIIDGNNIGSGAGQPVRNGLIGMGHVTRFTFVRSKCFNYNYICLEIPSSINLKVLDSEFTTWGYSGTVVTGDGGAAIYNQSGGTTAQSIGSLFRGNYFHDGRWTAIYVDQDFVVDQNIIENAQEAALITPYVSPNSLTKNGVISNNVINTITKHDISASCIETEGYGLIIIGNVITNCGHNGILVSDAINNVIKGNNISNVNRQGDGAQGSGIIVRSLTGVPKDILIQGNRIFDDQGVITSYACIGYIGTNPSTEQSVIANDCSNTAWVSGSSFLEYTAGRFGANSILRDNLPTSINQPCLVTEGCTGLAIGTSGGIPYFNSTTTMASSGLLTANGLVLGGGAGAAPSVLGSLGTTTTVLHGNAGGAPTFGSVVSADMNITTTTCTNQFVSAISAGGVGTCSNVNSVGGTDQTASLTAYTVTLSCAAGTITTSTQTGRSQALGKKTFVQIAINITAIGTCTGDLSASLPSTAAAFQYILNGRNSNTGAQLQGVVNASASTVVIQAYNAVAQSLANTMSVSGWYETP